MVNLGHLHEGAKIMGGIVGRETIDRSGRVRTVRVAPRLSTNYRSYSRKEGVNLCPQL